MEKAAFRKAAFFIYTVICMKPKLQLYSSVKFKMQRRKFIFWA